MFSLPRGGSEPGRGVPVSMATAPGGSGASAPRHGAARRLAIGRRVKKRGGDWPRVPSRRSERWRSGDWAREALRQRGERGGRAGTEGNARRGMGRSSRGQGRGGKAMERPHPPPVSLRDVPHSAAPAPGLGFQWALNNPVVPRGSK